MHELHPSSVYSPFDSRAAVKTRAFGFSSLQRFDGPLLRRFLRVLGVASLASASNAVHVDRELDRINGSLGAEVVHPSFQTQLPTMEMHRRELRRGGVGHVDVQ